MQSPSRTRPGKWPKNMNKREAGVLGKFGKQVQSVLWDFSADGGAVSTINFGAYLPANAVVTGVYTDEQTAVTAATSITLKAGSTALTGAIDFTASSGQQKPALAGSAAAIKVASASQLNIAIATTAATAGKVRFTIEFHISE